MQGHEVNFKRAKMTATADKNDSVETPEKEHTEPTTPPSQPTNNTSRIVEVTEESLGKSIIITGVETDT